MSVGTRHDQGEVPAPFQAPKHVHAASKFAAASADAHEHRRKATYIGCSLNTTTRCTWPLTCPAIGARQPIEHELEIGERGVPHLRRIRELRYEQGCRVEREGESEADCYVCGMREGADGAKGVTY